MKTRTEFLADCLHLLNIQQPLDLKVQEVINNWDASYIREDRRHVVRVAPKTGRCRLSLIAHELVHAAMDERHPKARDHGPEFRRTANKLQKQLQAIGWEFRDKIFIRGVDT